MKKYISIIGLFLVLGCFGQEYSFDHYAIYNGYNGFTDTSYKVMYFGNSKDKSIILKFNLSDDKVSNIQFEKEVDQNILSYDFSFKPFNYSDFKPEIHLKACSRKVIYSNPNLDYDYFDKSEILKGNIKKTVFTIYENKNKRNISKQIYIDTFDSEKVKNQKFYFIHSRQFIKKNVDFSPAVIQSYKLSDRGKILESASLIVFDTISFKIKIK